MTIVHFVGIDPGKTGAITVLDQWGAIVVTARFDKLGSSRVVADALGPVMTSASIALEAVWARTGQGVTSMFTFGVEYGRIQGWLDAKGLEVSLHTSQSWQKWLPDASDPKSRVKVWVEQTYGLKRFIFDRCLVPHQGCMDATGIAEYQRRLSLGLIAAVPKRAKAVKRQPLKF